MESLAKALYLQEFGARDAAADRMRRLPTWLLRFEARHRWERLMGEESVAPRLIVTPLQPPADLGLWSPQATSFCEELGQAAFLVRSADDGQSSIVVCDVATGEVALQVHSLPRALYDLRLVPQPDGTALFVARRGFSDVDLVLMDHKGAVVRALPSATRKRLLTTAARLCSDS